MFVTNDEFLALKRRHSEYAHRGYPNLDEGMREIIPLLNEIDGLVTVFCCEGHFKETVNTDRPGMLKMSIITSVLNVAALETLYRIHSNLPKTTGGHLNAAVIITRLVWPVQGEYMDLDKLYPVACLEYLYYVQSEAQEKQVKASVFQFVKEFIQSEKEQQNV